MVQAGFLQVRPLLSPVLFRIPWSIPRSAFIGLAVYGLVACSLGPRYERPDIPSPASWRDPHQGTAAEWPSARFGSIEVRPIEESLPTDRRYARA